MAISSNMGLAEDIHGVLMRLSAAYRRNDFRPAVGRDLTLSQLLVVSTLLEHGPMRMTELAEYLKVRAPTMTVSVRRLQAVGMVKRTVDPDDGRAVLVEVTTLGAQLHRQSLARREAFLTSLLVRLSPQDRRLIAAAIGPLSVLGSSEIETGET